MIIEVTYQWQGEQRIVDVDVRCRVFSSGIGQWECFGAVGRHAETEVEVLSWSFNHSDMEPGEVEAIEAAIENIESLVLETV